MSFITVKFGDDKAALFNPDCSIINLLDNIKRRCHCPKEIVIDLSDEDGIVQKLSEKYYQNASCVLKKRAEYILLKVEKFPADQSYSYTPLLNDLEHSNPNLLAKLNQNVSKPEEELPKQSSTARKKSAWDRVSTVRKFTSKTRESPNANTGRPSNEPGRENQGRIDEKYGSGTTGDRRTAKQRRPALVKT